MSKLLILLISLLALSAGCKKKDSSLTTSFYHWKTEFTLSPSGRQYLDVINSTRLYVKFFDVDWDYKSKSPAPLANIIWENPPSSDIEIVPTIFITNRVLQQLPIQEIPALAENIEDKILKLLWKPEWSAVKEIQIDCDWTAGTKTHYFKLLKALKSAFTTKDILLSATIRLHQIKYPDQTGVPPVARGMLMFYNMGDLQQWEEPNSILNLDKARPYLDGINDYPIPLDLALPIFQWGVVFRDGEMIRLISQLSREQLSDPSRFFPLSNHRYEVIANTFLDGTFLYEGDLLRLEGVDSSSLMQSAQLLKDYEWSDDFHLTFYHLDSTSIGKFDANIINEVVRLFEISYQ